MQEWEKSFGAAALERGKKLYEEDKVKNLRVSDTGIEASIAGNKRYDVSVTIKNGKILRMKCQCPKARSGNHCEHMAAVFYAVCDEEKEDDYSYFDIMQIRSKFHVTENRVLEGSKLVESGWIELKEFYTGYIGRTEGMVADVLGEGTDGRDTFQMRLTLLKDSVYTWSCDCPKCRKNYSWDTGREKCAYMAGLLQLTEEYLQENPVGDATDMTGAIVMHTFQKQQAMRVVAESEVREESLNLIPRLLEQREKLSLSFRIGSEKKFVIKNLFEFCTHVRNSETAVYGSNTKINHQLSNFTQRGKEWFRFINQVIQEETMLEKQLEESGMYDNRRSRKGALVLYGWRLDHFYQLMKNDSIEYENKTGREKEKRVLRFREDNPEITMKISKYVSDKEEKFHGINVISDVPPLFRGAGTSYFVKGQYFCKADPAFVERVQMLADISENGRLDFQVGRNNLSEFYYSVLPQFQDVCDIIEEDSEEIHAYLPPEVQFLFYLDAEGQNVTCGVYAKYGEQEVSVLDVLSQPDSLERFRMKNKEAEILYLTRRLFPEVDYQKDVLHCNSQEEKVYFVLENGLETLMELGEVHYTRRFRNMNKIRKVKLSVGVSVSSDLLNLEIASEGIDREELLEVLHSYRLRRKYHRLKNGDFLNLEDNTLEMLEELMTSMHLSPAEFVKGKMHLPVYRTLYLDKMLEENANVYNTRDSRFREMVKSFKTVNDADYIEPASLSGIMRGYQKNGYRWLRTLEACHFGGILADDMGLGKTLQAIAVLLAAKEEGKKGTSLIVSPASLVYNWGEELQRFAPKLNVLLVSGSQEERRRNVEEYSNYDVLVTSYDLLKRDIANYEDKTFLYQIIDEAQYIKNHTTAAAKAVKVIHSSVRFALTGTPIENRLSELWSIFDYLMPGFLYSYDVFRREIEVPIVRNADEDVLRRLQKMAGAFILRRMKNEVLKDLPDKLEEVRYVKMGKNQQKVYDAQVVDMKTRLGKQNNEEFNKNKLQILAELTRLRQICCDPELCFENYKGESAKLESCLDLIQSAIDGGHKILLFSQFTTMLEILQKRLQALKIPFYTITGTTTKKNRLEMVKAFNSDDTPIFLISLKAGGVGLNLTGADVVIHYDPWWNLAVQNQATDRAHRIGQTKKVIVYKLIVKHSLEEKIQKLQEEKMDLAEQIVDAQTGQLSGMSKEELLELLQA